MSNSRFAAGYTPQEYNKSSSPPHGNNVRQETTIGQDIGRLILKIIAIALVFVLLFTFMFGFYYNRDASMKPSIRDGDLIFFYRLDKNYVASDVIVLEVNGETEIRRVVAVAGDVVNITDEGLIINGAVQQEPDIYEDTEQFTKGATFPLTVGKGQVFVLADSRKNGTDSRVYGCVNISDTYGKIMTVLRRRGI
jgi:signal peptidase I